MECRVETRAPTNHELLREFERRKQVKYWREQVREYSKLAYVNNSMQGYNTDQLVIANYHYSKYSLAAIRQNEVTSQVLFEDVPQEALNALPEPYKNDSVLMFCIIKDVLACMPLPNDVNALGDWVSFFDPVKKRWST